MIYCISDIHGEYDLFHKLLNKIKFNENDILIVLGDIIDKGPDSIKLLKYIFSLKNSYAILGNHEYDFLKYYNGLMKKYDDYNFVLRKLQEYFSDGYLLDWETIDKLESLPSYLEFEDFICVHSGIPLKKDIKSAKTEELVYDRRFKDINYPVNDKCIIFGHTPVRYINDQDLFLYYKRENINTNTIKDFYKIHIDCGVYLSNVLGCLCIETCKSYYVRK